MEMKAWIAACKMSRRRSMVPSIPQPRMQFTADAAAWYKAKLSATARPPGLTVSLLERQESHANASIIDPVNFERSLISLLAFRW